MNEVLYWKWVAFRDRIRTLRQKLYILKFWEWILWRPTEPWDWKFPDKNIRKDESGTYLYIDGDLQAIAMASWRAWALKNPAPRWWRLWCKILRGGSTHECEGILGKAFGAIPNVVTGNTVIRLAGRFPVPEGHPTPRLGKYLMELRDGATVLLDHDASAPED